MKAFFQHLSTRYAAFKDTPAGQRVQRVGRRLVFALLVGYLLYQFSKIGWADILTSLPTSPLFYVIFLLLYFALPVTESLVYSLTWPSTLRQNLPAFLKKRVYNKDFLGYSGEVYLYTWARRNVQMSARAILSAIKDNTIVSSAASTVFAVSLLVAFLALGDVGLLGWDAATGARVAWGAVAVTVVLVVAAVLLRRRLFGIGARLLGVTFVIYFLRLVAMNVLQVGQWSLAVPGVGWRAWFVFLAVQVIVSRIPFLPARDLVFLGASVEVAAALGIDRAAVAGMLVALSACDKTLNLLLFTLVSAFDRDAGRGPEPLPPDEADAPQVLADLPEDATPDMPR